MRTISYRLIDLNNVTLNLGFAGENERTRILFDCKKVFDEYPAAVPALSVETPSGDSYPAVAVRDGNYVLWDVTDSDLIAAGNGRAQLSFVQDEVVVKTCIAKTRVLPSIPPPGTIPTPVANWLIQANTALGLIPQTILDALATAKQSGEFDGADGVGIVSIEQVSKVGRATTYRITLTQGDPFNYVVLDGEQGRPGYTPQKGVDYTDGFSPIISVEDITGGHRITILDASGEPKTIDVLNGTTPTIPVQDVQVNGQSVLENGVANVPYAGADTPGVVKIGAGLSMLGGTTLIVNPAGTPKIKQGTSSNLAITPLYLPEAAFYALSRLAGYDLKNSDAPVGTYPPEALAAIQKMLGVYEAPWELIRDVTFTNATEGDYLINVDKDGNPFELVDIRGIVWIPTQNNEAKLANGVVYVLNGSSVISLLAVDLKTVAANSAECGAYFMLEQKNSMMFHQTTGWHNVSVMGQVRMTLRCDDITTTPTTTYPFKLMAETATTAIQMRKLTGTFKIRLYGRRKWRT